MIIDLRCVLQMWFVEFETEGERLAYLLSFVGVRHHDFAFRGKALDA